MPLSDNFDELKSISDQLKENIKSVNDELLSTDSIVKNTSTSFESLVTISQQFIDHKSKENELDEKGLKNLIKRVQESNKSLKDSQVSLAARSTFLAKEKTRLEESNATLKKNSKQYKTQLDNLKDITEEINANNRAQTDLASQIASSASEVENLEKGLADAANQAKQVQISKDIGKGLDKINTPIDEYLSIWGLINKVIQFVIGGVVEYDKRLGDTAKTMSMTFDEADKSNKAMVSFLESTGNAVIASKELNKTVTDLNVQLGSAIKFENLSTTLKKDVALMAELETYAGMTAEESQGILNYTLATGQEATKATKQLMANYKVAGLKKGIVLNEKDAMKEIAKLSNSIKLSTAGGAAGLAKALGAAKALGTSLNKVDDIAGSILNFEESIESELSAELLLGKDLNLEKAREAALNNDLETLSNEIAKNVGSAAEFAGMNRIQQEAIAKAVGMTREELAGTLSSQEALKNISADSIEQAQELYNLAKANGTEAQFLAQLEDESLGKQLAAKNIADEAAIAQGKMTDGIIKALDSMEEYKDDFKQILDFVMSIVTNFGLMKKVLIAIGAIMAAKLVYQMGTTVAMAAAQLASYIAMKGALRSQSASMDPLLAKQALTAGQVAGAEAASFGTVTVAILAGLALVGAAIAGFTMMNDGVISPSTGGSGYGSRVLHGPEGAISFNNKDTIVAGTDLFKTNDMVSAPKGAVQIASNNDSSKDIAELKSAILALASRPVDVAIDGKKVIEATTGANPNTQGLESAKNSFKMQ
jgi:hypothetical protein